VADNPPNAAAMAAISKKISSASVGTTAFTAALFLRERYFSAHLPVQTKGRSTMKRVLIAIASVGVLAPTAWVTAAQAQYGSSPPPAYRASPANSPSQAYAQRYTRPARRSARRTPSGGTAFTPGSGPPPYSVSAQAYAAQSSAPFEWYAAPGPNKRGNECITHVDSTRGYGFRGACKK
jgi:hypothetical protein